MVLWLEYVLLLECALLQECVLLLECDYSHRRSQEGEQILETQTPGGSTTNSGNGKERKSASSCTTLEKDAVSLHSPSPDAPRNALFADSFGYFVFLCHELTVTLCLSSVCLSYSSGVLHTPEHTSEVYIHPWACLSVSVCLFIYIWHICIHSIYICIYTHLDSTCVQIYMYV